MELQKSGDSPDLGMFKVQQTGGRLRFDDPRVLDTRPTCLCPTLFPQSQPQTYRVQSTSMMLIAHDCFLLGFVAALARPGN